MSKLMLTLAMVAFCATSVVAGVTVEIIPAYGPSLDSPNQKVFLLNAIRELRGLSKSKASTLDRDDHPGGYALVPSGMNPYGEIFSSDGFHSWRGKADLTPGWEDGVSTAGAFSGEYGSAVYFGVRILVDEPLTEDIRLRDVVGSIRWEQEDGLGGFEPSDVLFRSLSVDFSSVDYDFARVGIDYGDDGVPGGILGNGDTIYDAPPFSGTNNGKPVDAIYMVGLADMIRVDTFGKPTDQEELDEAVRLLSSLPKQRVVADYSIDGVTGSAEVLYGYDPGDYDRDGDVDRDDYAVWTDEFGVSGSWRADGNADGAVDAADFTVWRDRYSSITQAASVPEPAGVVLSAIGLLLFLGRRTV